MKSSEQRIAEDLGSSVAHVQLAARCVSETHPGFSKELESIAVRLREIATDYTKDTKPYEVLQEG